MTDPTALPFQDDDRPGTAPEDSIYEGQRPGVPGTEHAEGGVQEDDEGGRPLSSGGSDLPPSETDRLAAQVTGADDQVGMTALWRLTMSLDHWWFIAVGDEGLESPAAATIEDQLMVLTFTAAERARDFAVKNGMIGPDEDLRAIALPPREVVESAETYRQAGIGGLMFDPHIAGYFIPTGQLPMVWDAVYSTAQGVDPAGGAGSDGADGTALGREG
ncbi:hypothetical protein [Ornithinimicrobium pratense]|uniref:SseB family protein n=1 Tax=Ornithinimicrobium pratense TaxID=2593973 RepID=A0A5J6V4K5_9MICO|nr:hypothetical protein [Ornithinimicrobium pratense]QFG68061.1 hypothetical protein FY030_04405 [Ornithinimicrobium pratense]